MQEFGCSAEAMPLVNKVFEAFDRDGNGVVTFREMMHGLGQVLTGDTESRAQFYFSLCASRVGFRARPRYPKSCVALHDWEGVHVRVRVRVRVRRR